MVVGMGMVVVGVFAVGVVLALALRSWTLGEAKTEARLRLPETHTVAYVVPEGQDPAIVMAALTHAGFVSVTDIEHGTRQLLVECTESDRAKVRSIIEHVDRAGFDGPEMHVGHVSFEDER